MKTLNLQNKKEELENFIEKAREKIIEIKKLQAQTKDYSLAKLAERSFAFWNNPKDAIYDNL